MTTKENIRRLSWKIVSWTIPIMVSIFAIYITTAKPVPTYSVKPPISLVKISNSVPELSIRWKEKEIENLFQTEILIWNDGRKYIDGRNVRNKKAAFAIEYTNNVRLLDHEIIRMAREDIGINIVANDKENHKIKLNFEPSGSLEPREGIKIRLLFVLEGKLNDELFKVTGGIKGIPQGWKLKQWAEKSDNKNSVKKHYYWWIALFEFLIFLALLISTIVFGYLRVKLTIIQKKFKKEDLVFTVVICAQLYASVFMLWKMYERWMFSSVLL